MVFLLKNESAGASILFAVLLLSAFGCTLPPKIDLTVENEGKLQKTRIVSIIPQEEITAEITQSNSAAAMGGGLIFALLDSSINNSRSQKMEDAIAELKKALSDYDFRDRFWEVLQSELDDPGRLQISQLETTAVPTPWHKERELMDPTAENSVLVLNTRYELTKDYRHVKLDSTVRLWLDGENRPVYARKYDFEISADDLGPKDDPISFWAENNGQHLRNILEMGIKETMNHLRTGLLNP